MTSIEVTAPAKVNLFLKVLSKRKDSYHNIFTLFERISLADTIKISKTPKGISVSSDKFITRSGRDNLVYKAADIILKHKRIKLGVNIKIVKRVPIGGGLGGGSSDAAATLIGINKLFNLRLNKKELIGLGALLGADVPFFILNTKFAVGRSKGEILDIIKWKTRFWHLLIYPGFPISTAEVYRSFDSSKSLTTKRADVKIPTLPGESMDFGAAESMLHNDLENVAISKKSVIGSIIRRLAVSSGKKAIVSGSGPSVFCLYKTRKEALRAKLRLFTSVPARERDSWQVFIVRTY